MKMFEINQRKLAKSRQNYGIQEVSSTNKEADLPYLGAAQDKGDKGNLGTKRKKKHVSRLAAVDCGASEQQSTPTQQPENLEYNHVPHGEPSAQDLNNSASVGRAANHGLKRKLDATPNGITLSESEVPQADEGILEQEGSRKRKSKAVLRASTIDEFLKENGMEMELEGLIQDGLGTEPQSDVGETLALDKDYSPHVMADIVVDEGKVKKEA
ncbi:hypothetical protein PIB30_072843 [Stylosanthes scabra]|uniref:Uncharacterized protein n=1 Tax=Stylosanthes scabra TaxID=79078 RepID=A0ABU6TRH8_9FABA|nr:hypothetical protein [Stylosanthes scabra]